MDAAYTRTKLSLLAALFLLGAGAAQAQNTFVFPNGANVTLVGQNGGSLPVQSSGSPISFTTATVNTPADDPNNYTWLAVNNAVSTSGTTPITLYFQIEFQAGQLSPGIHVATVNLTANDGSGATASITVTYDTSSGGGGSGVNGVVASPSSFGPTAAGIQNYSLQLSTASASAISFNVQTPTVSWLSVSPTSGQLSSSAPANLTVTFNPTGLPVSTPQTNIVINYGSTTLQVPVTYYVGTYGGGTGTGSLAVSQPTINWTFNTSGTAPGTQYIGLSTTGSATAYNTQVTSSGSWLSANNGAQNVSLGSGLVISPTSNIYSLATGQYTGTVLITANDGSTATVTVYLTVNGTTSGVSFSPNPVNFSATLNGLIMTTQVTVSSASTGSFTAQVTGVSASGTSPLSLTSISSNNISPGAPVVVTIQGNPTGLAAQTVVGQLTVTINGSTQTGDQINFTVGNPNSGGGGTTTTSTSLNPSTLNFAYQLGSAMPSSLTQQVYVGGTDSFTVTAPAGITVTPASFTAPGLVNVTVNASALQAGTTSPTVTFTGAASTATLTVNILATGSTIVYSPVYGDVYFSYNVGSSASTPTSSLLIYASDGSNQPVTATVLNGASTPWLGIGTSSANSATPATYTVTVNPASLANGVYQGAISVVSPATNNPLIIPVVLVVSGSVNSTGVLTLSSSSLTFPQVQLNGAPPASMTLQVGAATPTSFSASATTNNGGNWLNLSPSGALTTPQSLTVSANQSGLAVGTYTGQINLVANGVTQTVGVTLTVGSTAAGGNLTVTANGGANASLSFTSQAGVATNSQYLTITSSSGVAAVPFTVTTSTKDGNAWLQTGAVAGVQLQTPYNLTVSATPGSLPAGNYSGTITITPTGGNSVAIPVTLTVTGVPSATISASPLSFSFQVGQASPASQTVAVTASNASSVSFSAVASSTGWLSVTPLNGTAPGNITVSVNPAGLSAGTYSGNITVSGTNGAGGSTTIPVSLTITAPLPTISAVVNAASAQAGPVAPGEIISIYGTAMGPATAVTLVLSNGKVSTNIGGVQVYIGGYAAPLIFVSAGQINAVVPYEAAGLLSPSVLVLYLGQSSNGFNLNRAVSAPGIFTANSSGTGPGAILNGDNSFNTSGNPAARGSIVQVYLTGEGSTSPTGVTGSVTSAPTASQLPAPVLPVAVLVNNEPATAVFAAEAPGLVAGVLQVNILIPSDLQIPSTGVLNASLVISIGGNSSQTGVTVAVK